MPIMQNVVINVNYYNSFIIGTFLIVLKTNILSALGGDSAVLWPGVTYRLGLCKSHYNLAN